MSTLEVESSPLWDMVIECLVKFHEKTYQEAFELVVDFKRKLRQEDSCLLLEPEENVP